LLPAAGYQSRPGRITYDMTSVTWPLLTASRLQLLHAKFAPLLGRGLEPHFKVLFSAIFQGVPLRNFHQIRNLWKRAEAKVWSILVNPRTFFMCVLIIFYLPSAGL
jgi:hypothetical protein